MMTVSFYPARVNRLYCLISTIFLIGNIVTVLTYFLKFRCCRTSPGGTESVGTGPSAAFGARCILGPLVQRIPFRRDVQAQQAAAFHGQALDGRGEFVSRPFRKQCPEQSWGGVGIGAQRQEQHFERQRCRAIAVLRLDIEDHGQLVVQDAARDAAGEDGICRLPQFRKRAIPQFPAEQITKTSTGKAKERGVLSLVREDKKIAKVMFQLCGIDVPRRGADRLPRSSSQ